VRAEANIDDGDAGAAMDEPFAARRWTSRSRRGDGRAVRGAAMDEPFANNPSWRGPMIWDPEEG